MNRRLLLALPLCCLPFALGACGGDGASGTSESAARISTQTAAAGGAAATANPQTEPALVMPVSRYTVLLDDVGTAFLTDPASPFELTLQEYASSASFENASKGAEQLNAWGYQGGYEAQLVPEGREAAVLNGGFYVTIESHLFSSNDGAKQAYSYFESRLKANSANKSVKIDPIGNQWTAYQTKGMKVRDTSVDELYHRVMFRRGNLVVVIATYGADGFMSVNDAVLFAKLVDARALGVEEVIQPTPASNFTPPAGAGTPRPGTTPGQTPFTTPNIIATVTPGAR